jgi:hypothetical protein
MDTRNFVGEKATVLTVMVVTASGREAEVRLGVRSNILSDIVLNPGALHFGVVARGQHAEQNLTIDRHGAPSWKVERMLASRRLSQYIDATLTEAYRTREGVGYLLRVHVRSDAPPGALREEIRLATNDGETPIVPVLVSLEVRGALSVSPNIVSLGRASTDTGPVQGRFLVRGASPFAIRAVEGAGDGFEVTAPDESKKAIHVFTITFRPEQTTARGDLRRRFRVVTDVPGEAPVEVHAAVHVAP